eukprot:3922963-Rhodomonas_salina.1
MEKNLTLYESKRNLPPHRLVHNRVDSTKQRMNPRYMPAEAKQSMAPRHVPVYLRAQCMHAYTRVLRAALEETATLAHPTRSMASRSSSVASSQRSTGSEIRPF